MVIRRMRIGWEVIKKTTEINWRYIFLAVLSLIGAAIISRRRLYDLGLGAVFLGLGIIAFFNRYFLFIMLFKPGDEGRNEYGPEPLPNDRAVYLLAWLIPAIMVLAIVAALVLPAAPN